MARGHDGDKFDRLLLIVKLMAGVGLRRLDGLLILK